MIKATQTNITIARRWLAVLLAVLFIMAPVESNAAGLAPRSVNVGSSGQGDATSYIMNFSTATAGNIGSIGFQICTTATGACVLPSGVVTTGASVTAQNGATGFALNNLTNGAPYLTRVAAFVNSGTALSYTLQNITNPITTNLSYNVRITTYTGTDGLTGPLDTGNVALSTAQPVQLTGVTPEILVFCVGTSIVGNCGSISGSVIDFGDFSPAAVSSGTSVMQAQTNASSGYVITVNGTTLSSGVNTIPSLGAQTASTIGTSQFGLNLRANATPAVGVDPTGAGTGTYSSGYGTVNQYKFVNGDVVASANSPTNANTFTSSYLVNIGGAQAAGVYTATMTYICTASF